MNPIQVEVSSVIEADTSSIYAVLSDYRVGHPAILPKMYFRELVVEQGGQGAGTIVRGSLRVFGKDYPFHQTVSEPQPGRVLAESEIGSTQVTTFTLEPLDGGIRTRVTIASDFPPSPGVMGFLERLTKPAVTRRIYREELAQLAAYLQTQSAVASASAH